MNLKKIFASIIIACFVLAACQKELSNESGFNPFANAPWQFNADSMYFHGSFDSVKIVKTASNYSLVYLGGPADSGNGNIRILIAGTITAGGSYSSANGAAQIVYNQNGVPTYFSVPSDTSKPFVVQITSITDSTVVGTFSGKVQNAALVVKDITNGIFTAKAKTVASPTISVGTLGITNVDSCTGVTVSGTYKKGTALVSSTNTANISVNITTAGTYTITTDTVKGFYFNNAGTFTSTGTQSVVLGGVGTPTDTGWIRFTIKYGSSTCKFYVHVVDTTVAPVLDYFPITTNSNWSYNNYDSIGAITDTSYSISTGGTALLNSHLENIFKNVSPINGTDSSYYRKASGIYYNAFDLAALLGSGTGSYVEAIMLKDNVAQGATWADSYPVTVSGVPGTVDIQYTLLAKAVSATVLTTTYPDVIKVKSVLGVTVLGVFTPYLIDESWFARGTGFIYAKDTDAAGHGQTETKLRLAHIY